MTCATYCFDSDSQCTSWIANEKCSLANNRRFEECEREREIDRQTGSKWETERERAIMGKLNYGSACMTVAYTTCIDVKAKLIEFCVSEMVFGFSCYSSLWYRLFCIWFEGFFCQCFIDLCHIQMIINELLNIIMGHSESHTEEWNVF